MDLAFAELALAALGGASGSLSEAAVTDLWHRLRSRFSSDEEAVASWIRETATIRIPSSYSVTHCVARLQPTRSSGARLRNGCHS